MSRIISFTTGFFPRSLRRRRGSILIMVVAVLVLLALMGTAYISTARLDRTAAAPLNAGTAQEVIDQLLPSIVQMAEDAVTKDVVTSAGYRRPGSTEGGSDQDYENYDYPGSNWINKTNPNNGQLERANDAWLASRLPEVYPIPAINGGVTMDGVANQFWMWKSISRPLNQPDLATNASATMVRFDSPYDPGYTAAQQTGFLANWPHWTPDLPDKDAHVFFVPNDLTIKYPTGYPDGSLAGKVRVFPALVPYVSGSKTAGDVLKILTDPKSGKALKLLAGDADGDGVADGGLWKVTTIGDTTYYACTRIIDDNSAINVNTARSMWADFDFNTNNPTMQPNWSFPASVGLFEWLGDLNTPASTPNTATQAQRAEFETIQDFLLTKPNGSNPHVILQTTDHTPVVDPFDPAGTKTTSTADDDPTSRTDYVYGSQDEAWYAEVGSRVEYPGFRTSQGSKPASGPDTRMFRTFQQDVNLDLAYRFEMMNLNSKDPVLTSLDGVMFQMAPASAEHVYNSTPNYALNTPQASLDSRFRFLPPSESEYWFNYSFNGDATSRGNYTGFSGGTPKRPLRSILVTDNAVSLKAPAHNMTTAANVPSASMLPYGSKGRWSKEKSYAIGDICYYAPDPQDPMFGADVLQRSYLVVATAASGPTGGSGNLSYPNPPVTGWSAGGLSTTAGWAVLRPSGAWSPTPTYQAGDVVQYDPAGAATVQNPPQWQWFVCMASGTTGVGNTPGGGSNNWHIAPQFVAPSKVSLNTAPFEELFRGFWNVIEEGNTGNPPSLFITDMNTLTGNGSGGPLGTGNFDNNTTPATPNDPYIGNRFHNQNWAVPVNRYAFDPILDGTGGDTPEYPLLPGQTNHHPLRMLRSPIRSLPAATGAPFTQQTRRLTPQSVMQLRAALAAVNAMDMRDADSNVSSRRVTLQMVQGNGNTVGTATSDFVNVEAIVYGNEPQPYITEVYANTDLDPVAGLSNPNGYVAIELFNPYPFDIPLTNWKIAALNRIPFGSTSTTSGSPTNQDLHLTADPANNQLLVDFSTYGAATPIVPAHGYLLLENFVDASDSLYFPMAVAGAAAQRRPDSSGLPRTGIIGNAKPGNTASVAGPPPSPPQLNVAYMTLPLATPISATTPPNTIFNQEMVLLKPRRFDGTYTTIAPNLPGLGSIDEDPTTSPNMTMQNLVPVDQFDFTGLILPTNGNTRVDSTPEGYYAEWHYQRASNEDPATPGCGQVTKNWHFVYPGRYDATQTISTGWNTFTGADLTPPRQQGTQTAFWTPGSTTQGDPWDLNAIGTHARPVPEMTLGTTYDATTITPAASSNATIFSTWHQTFPVPMSWGNFRTVNASATPVPDVGSSIGHNPSLGTANAAFPFGGFSRNGDVLSVPFIGSYVIYDPAAPAGTIIEINSVSMDAAMAEDTNPTDDPQYGNDAAFRISGEPVGLPATPIEQLGRFCPSWNPYIPGGGGPAVGVLLDYDWARDIFDHFTAIQNYHDDFLPNADPARYLSSAGRGHQPSPVLNTSGAIANSEEDDAGAHGLINVNTASWEVLATLPLVVDNTGKTDFDLTTKLAKAIVYYRDVDDGTAGAGTPRPHGAFTTLFELNGVIDERRPGAMGVDFTFQNMMKKIDVSGGGTITATNDPDDLQGDFSPWNGTLMPGQNAKDGVRLDYEEKNLNLIRLSNLLTTRSDTFTCYVLVQAWKNAGTDTPQLVGEKRAAFLIDRSKLSTNNSAPKTLSLTTR